MFCGALVVVGLTAAIGKAQGNGVVAAVTRSDESIQLDGKLDEPAWRNAKVLTLTQQSPHPREATAYKTEARIVVTGDRLYIGVICYDPEPRKIAVHSMQRDDLMRGDDSVSIAFDTYGDKRTGYFFQVNAGGARTAGLISRPEPRSAWEGLCATRAS